jgi:alpha-amylase
MGNVRLCLAFHNHQPFGNFGEVFAQAYDDCYAPLLELLGKHPHARVALHHTGPLLEWLDDNRGKYLDDLRELVARGQVELLGGGFYEPMLAVLPDEDAVGQLRMMSEFCRQRLGKEPAGMWLAERVWEPDLPRVIARAGLRFTLADDTHFRYAGVDDPRLYGYYVTEKAGARLAIFPIDRDLRYAIPFREIKSCVELFTQLKAEANKLETARRQPGTGNLPNRYMLTYGDDGEKFGVWPGTKDWVWGKGWLDGFFRMVGERPDLVELGHFEEELAHPPSGRVYLPVASYEEMMQWALPAETTAKYSVFVDKLKRNSQFEPNRAFVRGGMWQGFLVKYPESNLMHKKMLRVSERVRAAEAVAGVEATRWARRELYRGQCNCGYWHGLFGGLYLNYLRDAIYRSLISAEVQADKLLEEKQGPQPGQPPAPGVRVEQVDLDGDLVPEVLITGRELNAYLSSTYGGSLFELDWRPTCFNVANVMARRPEAYHEKLRAAPAGSVNAKEQGLAELLVYDRHHRHSFLDHFLGASTTLDAFSRGQGEVGHFVGEPYQVLEAAVEPGTERARVRFEKEGQVGTMGARLAKTFRLEGRRLQVDYEIIGMGSSDASFAPEICLSLLAGHDPLRYYRLADGSKVEGDSTLGSRGELTGQRQIDLVDEAWQKLALRLTFENDGPEPVLWRFPLETISQSEDGFERTYQGSVVVPVFRSALAGGRFTGRIAIEVVPL